MNHFLKIKKLSALLLLFVSWGCGKSVETTESLESSIVLPAEYDEQEAVWLLFPEYDHLAGVSNKEVTKSIVETILPYQKVNVVVADQAEMDEAMNFFPEEWLKNKNFQLVEIPHVEVWMRDMGPVFVVNGLGKLQMVDFNFNAWGYSDTTDVDAITEEKVDERIAEKMNLPMMSTSMISEGGNRESNGEGTLMVVEHVEKGRNPNMSIEEMNAEFRRLLGVKKVIWLKRGLYEDDHTFKGTLPLENGKKGYTVVTTNGHIDEFARFVNDSTILFAEVPETERQTAIGKENHRRMEENLEILRNATDQDNEPFTIIRMPLPELVTQEIKPGDGTYDYISTLTYEDGSTFPAGKPVTAIAAASYLNFLITNKVVIGQKYWREGLGKEIKKRDSEAEKILQTVFPDRKIVMIDALPINWGGGGVHCITMQQPKATAK
jgi:agmatine deiminase